VQADQRLRIVQRHEGGDARPEVPATCAVSRVAQSAHEPMEDARDVAIGHRPHRPLREPIPGKGRNDEVEGGSIDPVGSRVRQQRDEREELNERAWPSVPHHQRDAIALRGALVHEVDAHAVDLRLAVREPRQIAFLGPPVERIGPVGQQLSQVAEVGSMLPWLAGRGVWQPRGTYAGAKIVQRRLVHVDGQWLDLERHVFSRIWISW
jgi:hypothetical protein